MQCIDRVTIAKRLDVLLKNDVGGSGGLILRCFSVLSDLVMTRSIVPPSRCVGSNLTF